MLRMKQAKTFSHKCYSMTTLLASITLNSRLLQFHFLLVPTFRDDDDTLLFIYLLRCNQNSKLCNAR